VLHSVNFDTATNEGMFFLVILVLDAIAKHTKLICY